MTICYAICNGPGRAGFGYLYDIFGFKILHVIAALEIVVGAAVYFISDITWLFFFAPIFAGFISSSTLSILPSTVQKKYGLKISAEVFGFVVIFYGLSALTAPIISKACNLSEIKSDFPYLIFFEIGAALGIIALIISFTLDEKPYNYHKDEDNEVETKDSDVKKSVEIEMEKKKDESK